MSSSLLVDFSRHEPHQVVQQAALPERLFVRNHRGLVHDVQRLLGPVGLALKAEALGGRHRWFGGKFFCESCWPPRPRSPPSPWRLGPWGPSGCICAASCAGHCTSALTTVVFAGAGVAAQHKHLAAGQLVAQKLVQLGKQPRLVVGGFVGEIVADGRAANGREGTWKRAV